MIAQLVGAALVVLNACQAGRAGIQLDSIGGFAEAFIHAGPGAFISSLWSVGDEPAATFPTEFYRQPTRPENATAFCGPQTIEQALDGCVPPDARHACL